MSGNHGEDVKECYYYLDSTPTHSYMKALYKYPQNEYPYDLIVSENRERTKQEQEFELADTGEWHYKNFYQIFRENGKTHLQKIKEREKKLNKAKKNAETKIIQHSRQFSVSAAVGL